MPEYSARRLPHLYVVGQPLFITWRLRGSLPHKRLFSPELTSGQAFVAMDRILDAAETGPRYLSMPEIGATVADAIRYQDCELRHCDLHAFVVMANHVHLLITPRIDPATLMHSLKRFTARQANSVLGRSGQFWQRESYDRLVRDGREFDRIKRHIETNPVKAGLVTTPEDFLFSSARRD